MSVLGFGLGVCWCSRDATWPSGRTASRSERRQKVGDWQRGPPLPAAGVARRIDVPLKGLGRRGGAGGGEGRTHLLLALVVLPLTMRPLRDGAGKAWHKPLPGLQWAGALVRKRLVTTWMCRLKGRVAWAPPGRCTNSVRR